MSRTLTPAVLADELGGRGCPGRHGPTVLEDGFDQGCLTWAIERQCLSEQPDGLGREGGLPLASPLGQGPVDVLGNTPDMKCSHAVMLATWLHECNHVTR